MRPVAPCDRFRNARAKSRVRAVRISGRRRILAGRNRATPCLAPPDAQPDRDSAARSVGRGVFLQAGGGGLFVLHELVVFLLILLNELSKSLNFSPCKIFRIEFSFVLF